MVKFFMNCPYCNHRVTYKLKTAQEKCARCQRKFSPQKIGMENRLLLSFIEGNNIKQTAETLQIHYITVKKRYERYRGFIVQFLENEFQNNQTQEYDEYIYLSKNKKRTKENIFEAQNFLTFRYAEKKVYNLLMPNLLRYKQQFQNESKEIYFQEFSRFMMFNKINKRDKKDKKGTTIVAFWNFFESFILQYKGVSEENFFYYLKECEFKFNYSKEEQIKILS